MRVVAVPNALRDAIHASINRALAGRTISWDEREIHYHQLLEFYDLHGKIPEFELSGFDEREDEKYSGHLNNGDTE